MPLQVTGLERAWRAKYTETQFEVSMNYRLYFLSLVSFLIYPSAVFAKDIPVQVRLFMGMVAAEPSNTNETLELQGLDKLKNTSQLGLEITYPLFKYLDVGARYTKILADSEENPKNPATDFNSKVDQDTILLIARVPFLKTDIFRMDAFAGVGGSNTSFRMKTAAQNGELSSKGPDGWFGSPYAAAGVSAGIGFKYFYLVFESGYAMNKVSNFKRSGNISNDLDTLDLSGSYFTLGLMFDGVPGSVGK